jgi:RNA polymerase sigma-70 factor (ECF subfamily)
MRKIFISSHIHEMHCKLCEGNPKIAKEFQEALFRFLIDELFRRCPRVDEQIVSDAIFDHCAKPQQYDADKGVPLDRYLAAAARRNVQDHLRSERRRKHREREVGRKKSEADVALDPVATNSLQEEKELLEEEIWACLEAVENQRDHMILLLRLAGFRETATFARLLQITHLSLEEQRKEVKRHKDRIQRFLTRKGLGLSFLT